ncbi:MAG: STAS domain-containing protein [Spirochaetes bacterium]|nr:STAS domain-containing protein [Spirochaetota bacterium]
MDISFGEAGSHKIVRVMGDVDLYNVGDLKRSVFELIDEGDLESLVIDMANVNYIDSSGVGALVAAQKKMKTQGGKFGLMGLTEDVLNILKLATLDQFFKIYLNETQLP